MNYVELECEAITLVILEERKVKSVKLFFDTLV